MSVLRLLPAVVLPFLTLFYVSLVLPQLLGPQEFSIWRVTSAFLAFAGAVHLGLADGLYKLWIQRRQQWTFSRASLYPQELRGLLLTIGAVALIFSLCFLWITGFGLGYVAVFFLGTVIIGSFSVVSYAFSINENGLRLVLLTSAQPVLFLVLLTLLGRLITAEWVLLAYVLSFVPTILMYAPVLLSRKKTVPVTDEGRTTGEQSSFLFYPAETEGNLREIYTSAALLRNGKGIFFSNLSLIFYLNADKLLLPTLGPSVGLASYLLSSSLFVAASGLGSSVGNLLLSKSPRLFLNTRRRLLCTAAVLLLGLGAGLLVGLVPGLYPQYAVNWTLTGLVAASAFAFACFYAPLARLYLPRQSMALLVPAGAAIVLSTLLIRPGILSFEGLLLVLLATNLVVILLHELTINAQGHDNASGGTEHVRA